MITNPHRPSTYKWKYLWESTMGKFNLVRVGSPPFLFRLCVTCEYYSKVVCMGVICACHADAFNGEVVLYCSRRPATHVSEFCFRPKSHTLMLHRLFQSFALKHPFLHVSRNSTRTAPSDRTMLVRQCLLRHVLLMRRIGDSVSLQYCSIG